MKTTRKQQLIEQLLQEATEATKVTWKDFFKKYGHRIAYTISKAKPGERAELLRRRTNMNKDQAAEYLSQFTKQDFETMLKQARLIAAADVEQSDRQYYGRKR